MSFVHRAEISPSKQEVARSWLSDREWFSGDPANAVTESRWSYRYDDPDGEVGVESVLIRHDAEMFQLPLTYRGSELPSADHGFLTHMDHSVLGTRWVYFGLTDLVMVNALVAAIRTGRRQEDYEVAGQPGTFASPVTVRGTGRETSFDPVEITGHEANGPTSIVHTTKGELVVPHVLGSMGLGGRDGLVGQWPGGPQDVVFAVLGNRAR